MLTAQQKAWADEHVGIETTAAVTGVVDTYVETSDGLVLFRLTGDDGSCSTFTAQPPYTDDARERDELAAAAEQDEAQRLASQAEAERLAEESDAAVVRFRDEVRAEVDRRLAELGVTTGPK